ncbi:hypothetical protein ZWY2020_027605 [Hordeum vulgare]|nr:hypothetical protein ZWY2020_027605 [Hordeum vulgare]
MELTLTAPASIAVRRRMVVVEVMLGSLMLVRDRVSRVPQEILCRGRLVPSGVDIGNSGEAVVVVGERRLRWFLLLPTRSRRSNPRRLQLRFLRR